MVIDLRVTRNLSGMTVGRRTFDFASLFLWHLDWPPVSARHWPRTNRGDPHKLSLGKETP